MNYLRSILFIISILLGINANAQGFYQTYSPASSIAQDVVQTDDGGYFLAGFVSVDSSLFLQRVDAAGQHIWANNFNFNHAKAIATSKTDDGGFAVLSEFYADTDGYKNAVLKLGATGIVEWTRVIDNYILPNGLRDIVSTEDGGFLVAGDTRDSRLNFQNWLVKLAPNGDIAWKKTYGAFHSTSRIIALSTGNYAISGGRNGGNMSLTTLTPAGDMLWQQVYTKLHYQRAYDLLETVDGGISIFGTTQNQTLDIGILKTDINGTELWFKNFYPYSEPNLVLLKSFAQDTTGNFYIPIWDGDLTVELLKLNPEANPLWKRKLSTGRMGQAIVHTNDNYLAIAGGSSAYLLKLDTEAEVFSNKIIGTVYYDANDNCNLDTGESVAGDYIVEARNSTGAVFYKKVEAVGTYEIRVPEGEFDLLARPTFGTHNYKGVCDTLHVSVVSTSQTVDIQPIGVRPFPDCPVLKVYVASGTLRRCVNSRYFINWCNCGNVMAENASVQITADTVLQFTNSSIPLTAQNGNVFSFDIPNVGVGGCGGLYVDFLVKCSATIGQVICVEAHAFPDTTCIPPDPAWDGSEIAVTGHCENDTLSFKIKNNGASPMSQSLDYVIIEDHIMYMQGMVQLGAGVDTTIVIPNPTGDCYLGRVLEEGDGVSVISRPAAVVANCITGGNLNLALQFQTGANEWAIASTCGAVVGSFDPNDKRGFPLGWNDQHLLERNEDITYTIRFQNLGNDTAFLVIIRDELPVETLDPGTVRPIAASHPYTWDLTGNGSLSFTFPNILLPDSTTNEPASHGFVQFQIKQRLDLPDGTRIENSASIFFDFNDPVITNEYFHTIGRPMISVTKTPSAQLLEFQVFPNPFSRETTFVLKNYSPKNDVVFRLFDAWSRLVQTERFAGDTFQFNNPNLGSGIYFFRMEENGKLLTSGKVSISK